MNNNEKDNFGNHEAFDEKKLEDLRSEQQDRLKEDLERSIEKGAHENVEDARKDALDQAGKIEKEQKVAEKESSKLERRGPITKKEKDASFEATMGEIRMHMSAPGRAFSSFIHNKTVEKVSESVGNTVARPNAILSGAVFAFLFTLVIYLVARHNGYPISGSETIASFALGWILGLLFDYIRVLVLGKNK